MHLLARDDDKLRVEDVDEIGKPDCKDVPGAIHDLTRCLVACTGRVEDLLDRIGSAARGVDARY